MFQCNNKLSQIWIYRAQVINLGGKAALEKSGGEQDSYIYLD
jgi:hypothetical protein